MTETPNPQLDPETLNTLTGDMHPIRRVVVSIGANLGDRMTALQGAVDSLEDTPEVWVTGVSPVYETEPIECPEDAQSYLNAVVLLDTTLSAQRLLDRALAIEAAYGRVRDGQLNAPRTLDVDLIVVGERRAQEPHLVLPHPRAKERAFVLRPWHDLEPDAAIPDAAPVADLLAAVADQEIVRRDDLRLTTR